MSMQRNDKSRRSQMQLRRWGMRANAVCEGGSDWLDRVSRRIQPLAWVSIAKNECCSELERFPGGLRRAKYERIDGSLIQGDDTEVR